jgi:hypothetical protein
VRGAGSGTNAGFERSVGMFIDRVYSGGGALDLDPATHHDEYTMWNARVAPRGTAGVWSVAFPRTILTDERINMWQNDVALSHSNCDCALPERPRVCAIQARYRF